MTDILNKILATKVEEVAAQKTAVSLEDIKAQAQATAPVRGFIGSIREKRAQNLSAIIAEVEKASPSKGLVRLDFHPAEITVAYEKAGTVCLPVLTDEPHFQGSSEYLKQVRTAVALSVLRKGFIIDEHQIYQARAWGADAILPIAAVPEAGQLERLEAAAHGLGMIILLELYDASKLEKCRNMATPLWGVNNRNLRTFEVTPQQTFDLLPELNDRTVVVESGIRDKEGVDFMRDHGVHTSLIGETFMRADDIEAGVKKLF